MILIDTCVFLWLTIDQKQLSKKAVELIQSNVSNLSISAISAFEIGLKARKKQLKLPMTASKWFRKAIDLHGIEVEPITGEIAMLATQLPQHHRDPADRIIIATALVNQSTILTPDQHIHGYSKIKVIW